MRADPFRELERGHEAKFKLDEELRFKCLCRRTKLLGVWAAERMGVTGAKADAYARSLLRATLDSPSATMVLERIARDLAAAGASVPDADIEMMAERCYDRAVKQVLSEFPTALDVDHVQIGG